MPDFRNLCEVVIQTANKINNPNYLNFRENGKMRSFSSQEFVEKILEFACGLKELGFMPNQKLANYSYQNPIWLIVDFATILAEGVSVPIFHNISQENLQFEITDSEANFLFTDNLQCLNNLGKCGFGLKIISYGLANSDFISFEKVLELGKKSLDAKKYHLDEMLSRLNKEETATIIYTSGSTNQPKGVMISHQNLLSQIQDAAEFFPLQTNDVALSFLPLAHIFERMVMLYYLSCGISIYFVDDHRNLSEFLKIVKPTLMTVVPRVMEKAHNAILAKISAGKFLTKLLGRQAYQRAITRNFSNSKLNFIDKFLDFLVYRKFRQGLGGNVRMIICGGSALNPKLENFFWNVGIKIYCGYGLTEASPVLAANCPANFKLGSVGRAFPSVSLKISETGELLAKGENIMRGYFRLPEKTSEQMAAGWLKTGDEAQIDETGFVKITGRKKEIVKNSYGKFVNLAKIEQDLSKELGFLIGSIAVAEGKNFTSALLFPDFENFSKFLQTNQSSIFKDSGQNFDIFSKNNSSIILEISSSPIQQNQSFASNSDTEKSSLEICSIFQNQDFQSFIVKKITEINQNLDHWEEIKKVAIIGQEISIESGEITPSMKLKRKIICEKFAKEISTIYQSENH